MQFEYEFINTDHLTKQQINEATHGFDISAYMCQRRIEQEGFDGTPESIIGDSVNVFPDAIDEAYIVDAEIDEDEVLITVDFSKVVF